MIRIDKPTATEKALARAGVDLKVFWQPTAGAKVPVNKPYVNPLATLDDSQVKRVPTKALQTKATRRERGITYRHIQESDLRGYRAAQATERRNNLAQLLA